MAKLWTATLIGAGLALAAGTAPAQAQPQTQTQTQPQMRCSDHGKLLGQFASAYKEAPVAAGLTQDGRLLEVLSSGDTGTWTILLSKPDGTSCVIMAGEAWRKLDMKPPKSEPKV